MGNPLVHAPGGSRRLGERRLALCGAYSRNFPDPALRPWQGVTCPRCLARRMREPAQASPTESLVSVFGPFDSCPEATSPCKPCYGVGFEPSSIDIRQPVCKACDGTGTAPVTPQASPTGAEGAAFWKSLHEIAICCLRTLLVNLEVDGADDLIAHGAGPETYREIGRKIAQRPLWDGEEQKEIGVYKHRIRELERQNRGPQAGSEGVRDAFYEGYKMAVEVGHQPTRHGWLDSWERSKAKAAQSPALPTYRVMDHEGVWCCEQKSSCRWQGFALHKGLSWGKLPESSEWRSWHDKQCDGRLIQLLQPSHCEQCQGIRQVYQSTSPTSKKVPCPNCSDKLSQPSPDEENDLGPVNLNGIRPDKLSHTEPSPSSKLCPGCGNNPCTSHFVSMDEDSSPSDMAAEGGAA